MWQTEYEIRARIRDLEQEADRILTSRELSAAEPAPVRRIRIGPWLGSLFALLRAASPRPSVR